MLNRPPRLGNAQTVPQDPAYGQLDPGVSDATNAACLARGTLFHYTAAPGIYRCPMDDRNLNGVPYVRTYSMNNWMNGLSPARWNPALDAARQVFSRLNARPIVPFRPQVDSRARRPNSCACEAPATPKGRGRSRGSYPQCAEGGPSSQPATTTHTAAVVGSRTSGDVPGPARLPSRRQELEVLAPGQMAVEPRLVDDGADSCQCRGRVPGDGESGQGHGAGTLVGQSRRAHG